MLVLCLHRVPVFVVPLHCTVLLVPCVFLELYGTAFAATGGLHILQASRPSSTALGIEILEETFSTILQVAKWYFLPEGVL